MKKEMFLTVCLVLLSSMSHLSYADKLDKEEGNEPSFQEPMSEEDGIMREKVKSEDQDEAPLDDEVDTSDLKVVGSINMSPSFRYSSDTMNLAKDGFLFNKLTVNLGVKKVIEGGNGSKMSIVINGVCKDMKLINLGNTYVKIDDALVIGYTMSSIFYPNSNSDLPITAVAKTLQLKWEDNTGDFFKYGVAIEGPGNPKIGKQVAKAAIIKVEEKEKGSKELNKLEFVPRNMIPALGIYLGVQGARYDIALRGVGRYVDCFTEYKSTKLDLQFTGIVNLGAQYKFTPDTTTATIQGVYSFGMGDYIGGLIGLSEKDKEAITLYYNDHSKKLIAIKSYGVGGTIKHCWTPEFNTSVGGGYLAILRDKGESKGFDSNIVAVIQLGYKLNDHIEFSGDGSWEQKYVINDKKELEDTFLGGSVGVKLSL